MTKEVEGKAPKVEEKTPAPEVKTEEKVEKTPQEETTTLKYSQHDLDEAVGKGLSSTNQQLSAAKAEAEAAKAETVAVNANVSSLETQLQNLQKEHDELVGKQLADDPDALKAYKDRSEITRMQAQNAKETADVKKQLYDLEHQKWQNEMDAEAQNLVAKTGIDINEFVGCTTVAEMKAKAWEYKANKEPEKKEPEKEEKSEEVKPPQYSTIASDGGAVGLADMSPKERLAESARRLREAK